MNQYGEPIFRDQEIHATHTYTRKFCGCMSLQGGGILACLIWLGLNLYGAILSFQDRSPIFSYLDHNALMVQGAVCVTFLFAALFALFALIANKPAILRNAHRTMWIVVFIFIINLFIDIILFGVQRPQFNDWCIDKSRNQLDDNVNITLVEQAQSANLYNCDKLWEDELKFAIVLFVMIAICYMYWALCLWSYAQKRLYFFQPFIPPHFGPTGPAAGAMPPPHGTLMNLKPQRSDDLERGSPDITARAGTWLSSMLSRLALRSRPG
ncbi:hypothetical protein BJV82DRAFT_638484 [Fennellomyces sp. T-0311]|nr:hypothetical protein BJV82DRAFT_638484 [Fennellomyces sp. T-0311]